MLKKSFRVYVLIGDGECQEGQIWEAAMFASHNRLHNLSVIVDQNRLQVSGKTAEVLSIEPLAEKWTAFGWNVLSVDGHDVGAITSACLQAEQEKNPTVLIARTIKGKGVSFMENNPDWHSFQALDEQHVKIVQRELGIS
jgi:transketolase